MYLNKYNFKDCLTAVYFQRVSFLATIQETVNSITINFVYKEMFLVLCSVSHKGKFLLKVLRLQNFYLFLSRNSSNVLKQHQLEEKRSSMFETTALFSVLRPRHELLVFAESVSTLKNIDRARKMLFKFARKHNLKDLKEVEEHIPVSILNLLPTYCVMRYPSALGDDSMIDLTQKLWRVYEENGRFQNWVLDDKTKKARGNSLKSSADIDVL